MKIQVMGAYTESYLTRKAHSILEIASDDSQFLKNGICFLWIQSIQIYDCTTSSLKELLKRHFPFQFSSDRLFLLSGAFVCAELDHSLFVQL